MYSHFSTYLHFAAVFSSNFLASASCKTQSQHLGKQGTLFFFWPSSTLTQDTRHSCSCIVGPLACMPTLLKSPRNRNKRRNSQNRHRRRLWGLLCHTGAANLAMRRSPARSCKRKETTRSVGAVFVGRRAPLATLRGRLGRPPRQCNRKTGKDCYASQQESIHAMMVQFSQSCHDMFIRSRISEPYRAPVAIFRPQGCGWT